MKKKLSIFCSLLLALQMIMSVAVMPVFAEEDETATYTAPDSPSVTYNMNVDWKFYDTHNLHDDIFTAMAAADKNGKKFYEKDYDDSDWETVSIPHAPGGGTNAFASSIGDSGGGLYDILLYRKTFTVPSVTDGTKIFFELEGIRQAAYVWVNGQKVGYYEAGIAPMGFDITNFVTPGEQAVIAICNDGSGTKGNPDKKMHETVPGEEWGSSYANKSGSFGNGAEYGWNTRDFNEPQIGLVYDAYLHVKGNVYQTLPLYNNLKTTGNYIYASDFDIMNEKAKIHVDAEIRNESGQAGDYTLHVDVVDHLGKTAYSFDSAKKSVAAATDVITERNKAQYMYAVEDDVYSADNLATPQGITQVNTPDVEHITAEFNAEGVRFWSLDDPYLYTVYTILKDSTGKVVDVQSKKTGFRKIEYSNTEGIKLNDKAVWLKGYAQRATNEWAVIGIAPDWLSDYDMSLLKENNANFIRWMHVAPKPYSVRSSDKYGVAVVVPAGDKEGVGLTGRGWSQKVEAMRDVIIYFRNSPSVFFYETGNGQLSKGGAPGEQNALDMARMRTLLDPNGMRFIGARSTQSASELNYDWNYAGTMYGNYGSTALNAMKTNGKYGPIMETEYARAESPRRVWDRFSPPDYDYINKHFIVNDDKADGYDVHDMTQEEITVANVKEYSKDYYQRRMGTSNPIFSAAAMMVWSDSNMHTRNSGTENCRTSGRVDAVRQTKEMFEGTKTAQSEKDDVHIVGHWSYPEVSEDTYNYLDSAYTTPITTNKNNTFAKAYKDATNAANWLKRDPTKKTVYVIGSLNVAKVELYRVDGKEETLLGTDDTADQLFVYEFPNVDVTQGDAVIAKAYNARNTEIAMHTLTRTGEAKQVKLIPHTAPEGWRADGSDIAYFDVQVLDENGNVCVLNYDKIEFEVTDGADVGTYLGGYNSGTGNGTQMHSKYFGGSGKEVSTIGKNYVYAENGTNRIFIKSTQKAGDFKIRVKLEGQPWSTPYTLTSEPFEVTGGLTTEMQATLDPGVSTEKPVVKTVDPMIPLMKAAWLVDWTKTKLEQFVDTNVYYTLQYNGTDVEIASSLRPREGINNAVFGPVLCILEKLKEDGAITDYSYENKVLSFTAGGHTYTIDEGGNSMVTDGDLGEATEITQEAMEIDGEFFLVYGSVIGVIPGVKAVPNTDDPDNRIVNITYTAPTGD